MYVTKTIHETAIILTRADMLSGPIVAMVWEGRDACKTGRSMSFPTNTHLID